MYLKQQSSLIVDIHVELNTTDYNWNAKYGGIKIADKRKLKKLADETRPLKRLYYDLIL